MRATIGEISALSLLILLALLLATALFWGSALLATFSPPTRRAVQQLTAALSAACFLAGVAALLHGGTAALPLPLGLPGLSAVFALDPVSAAFLPAASLACGATALIAPVEAAGRVALLAGTAVLLLCAGDATSLVIAAGVAVLAGGPARSARALVVSLGLAASLAVLLPHAGLLQSQSLPALRTEAMAGAGRGAAVPLALVPAMLLTAGAGAGIAGAILPVLGVFLAVRVMFDLAGPATPFVSALIVAGAALAAACWRGVAAIGGDTLDAVADGIAGVAGFVALAEIGVGLTARAADLPQIASASLAAGLLMILLLSVAVPLLQVAISSVVEQAGSRRLAALGGLAAPMRATAACVACALAILTGLPPLAGFAPLWMLVQSLLSAQRFGGLATPIVLALALAGLGLAIGLGLVAGVRLLSVVFGGRPRTPRGAAAAEARPPALRTMAVLAALLLAVSIVPGVVLTLFDRAVLPLTGAALLGRAGPLAVRVLAGGPCWSPLLLLLAVAPVGGLAWWSRRRSSAARDDLPVWDGGAAPPPDWLPFGEPLAQASAAGSAASVFAALGFGAVRGRAHGRGSLAAVAGGCRFLARRLTAADRMVAFVAPALLTAAIALVLLSAVLRSVAGLGGRLG